MLAIEVEEGEDRLAAALAGHGIQAVADGRTIVIAVADDRPYDVVRDALAELGLSLVRLQQRRGSVEDLFRDGGPVGTMGSVAAAVDGHGAAAPAAGDGPRR
jgi:ABC-2 type transport system ATP-binding protein